MLKEGHPKSGQVSVALQEALARPPLAPHPMYKQIVAGVLIKYVNFGKGWRHRLFVLHNGVLRYYKVFGESSVNVHALFERLRKQGELTLIGAETSIVENKCKRVHYANGCLTSPGSQELTEPQAELHLQVSRIQESSTDYRKFYIYNGTKIMRLRAETKEDRLAWLEALHKAKAAWEDQNSELPHVLGAPAANTKRIVNKDNVFLADLEGVQATLRERGASAELAAYVEDLLVQQHQRYHDFMCAEADKRRILLEHLHTLENEKRQLETALVVESRMHHKSPHDSQRRLLLDGGDGWQASEVTSEQSDTDADADEDDGLDRADSSSSDEAADVFYDAIELELQRSLSLTRSLSSGREVGNALASLSLGDEKDKAQQQQQAAVQVQALPAQHADGARPAPEDGSGAAAPPAEDHTDRQPRAAAASAPTELPEPEWLKDELPGPQRRTALPQPAQQEKSVSLWAIIKECVGKDLSRVCLPVYFNEPLSALQRIAEEMEYSHLLDQAAREPAGSVERMMWVGAFAVSGYSSTAGRTSKPFNPLLGETYELVHAQKGLRAIVEKVVHHPTVLAAYCEGRGWTFEGDADVKSKFWGRSIELTPLGMLKLTFHDGDAYTWNKVVSSINNLIIGKIYIDHGGSMRITSSASGLVCRLKFREKGVLRMHEAHEVKGHLENAQGERLPGPLLLGKWDEGMWAQLPDGSQRLLWEKAPPPPNPTRYNLTQFAIQLNEVTPGLEAKLAPTDCRLRPDQHALELGQYDQANEEKLRLETKQRAARKAAERGEPIRPRWFTPVEGAVVGRELAYKYCGGYFEAREAGDWSGVRDIFGTGSPNGEPGTPVKLMQASHRGLCK